MNNIEENGKLKLLRVAFIALICYKISLDLLLFLTNNKISAKPQTNTHTFLPGFYKSSQFL